MLLGKIAGKIKKALKIVRNEGCLEFTKKLSKRIVYGMVNAAKAKSFKNRSSSQSKVTFKSRFIEKKILNGIQMRDGRISMERLFADIKEEILRIKNK